uniref:bifunctional UDP-sugar hydrolase/5'-nucleotidase UshA n=1 Tax=Yersinia frederiksenii TaxID=29484 RepID=UPI001F4C214E|nr:bifunctional UDP-sugar hydrolase/5'-nucleotidase UshA [Yersinia frederiksenii]ULG19856.1 bifunctional metallophosphatase/5'-nucleotidase [Yersinia frederiksenii]
MLFLKRLLLVFAAPILFMVAGFTGQGYASDAISFTVLHTNDHHGAYWEDASGNGGLANRQALIEGIREDVKKQGGFVLLLDAGDVNTGTPESDLMLAEPDFKAMAMLKYDAMTLGNHEFDNSPEVLRRQQSLVNFPFLSANIYDEVTGQRIFTPYHIVEKNSFKVAIFGLTTVQTKVVGSKKNLSGLDFRPHASEALKALAELRQNKPDVVIALTHLGYYQDGNYGSNSPGDVTLARELPTGSVDMIIGGHSHTAVCMKDKVLSKTWREEGVCQPDNQNNIWIFQALESGRYLGRADFSWQDGQLKLENYQLIPILSVKDKSPATQAVYTLLESYKKQSDAQISVPIAKFKEKYIGDRDEVRNRQTNMGALIIAAQMDKTQADFGIISSGSIRSSIDAGIVSYRDVLKVQPFGNTVTYVDLTGQELLNYLNVVLFKNPDSGAYAQYHNITFIKHDSALSDVKIKGDTLDVKKKYRMSLPSYNANGGDGYPELNQHPSFVNTGYVDAEVLKSFISRIYRSSDYHVK